MIGVGGLQISENAKRLIREVLDSNQITYASKTREFEKKFAKFHNLKHAIFVNSGTSALQIAIHALKIINKWKGGEILCPAVTFVASANTIVQNGFKPVFVDVTKDTFNIDPEKIEEKITPKTKAIMVVHLCGQPADMDSILKIAKKHKLRVIEDACEAVGADVGYGDVSCFSTYSAHTLVTGVGGLACTNNKRLALLMRSLANHGRDGIYFTNKSPEMKMSKRFLFHHVGYSYRPTEMESALGLDGLRDLKRQIKKRRKNAYYLNKGLEDLPIATPVERYPHTYMMYPLIVNKREKFLKYLERNGIETRYLLPLINQPIYKTKGYPVAEYLNEHAFYIGCHPFLTKKDLDYIIKVFHDYEGWDNRI